VHTARSLDFMNTKDTCDKITVKNEVPRSEEYALRKQLLGLSIEASKRIIYQFLAVLLSLLLDCGRRLHYLESKCADTFRLYLSKIDIF